MNNHTFHSPQIALPESPPWFEIFGTNQTQIESVCCKLLQLYTIGRPLKSNLDEQLINLRQRLKSQKDDPKYARDDSTSKPENGAKSSALNMEQVEKGQVKVIERTEDVSSAITNRTIDVDRHLESHSKALHSSSSVSLSSLSTSYARDYNKHTRGRTREYDDSSSTRRHRDREREVTSDDSIRSRHKKRSKHDSDVRNDYKRERR